jgi:hypothetical protein
VHGRGVPVTDRTLRISAAAVFRELDGEAVILHLDSGTYFGLDHIGTRVWQLIEAHGSLERVIADLLTEYEVEAGQLRADVEALVSSMVDKGLIERS